jgi:hypothetical protein
VPDTWWDDSGVVASTTYYYVVRADTPAGVSSDSAEVTATTATPPDPLVISGRVWDPIGNTLPGISVTVLDWYYGTVVATGTTDADGVYRISVPRTQRVKLQFDDPTSNWARRFNGDADTFAAAADINVDGSAPVEANETLVPFTGTLIGVVTDTNGNPLAGIEVTVRNASYGNIVATATTDGYGWFEVYGLQPNDVTVKFVDPSGTFASVRSSLKIESATWNWTDAQMAIGGNVAGTVTVAGAGQPGVAVLVLSTTAPVEIAGSAYTGADGSYTVTNLPPGDYKVLFVDPGVLATPRTGLVPVFYGGPDALSDGLYAAYDAAPTVSVVSGETLTADQAMVPIITIDVGPAVSVAAGASTSITATVIGYQTTGTVTFTVDGVATSVALIGGIAVFGTPTTLAPGEYEITITYDGDASNEAALAAPVTLTVT